MGQTKVTVAELHRYTHSAAEQVQSPDAYEYDAVVRIDGVLHPITGASVDKGRKTLILDAE